MIEIREKGIAIVHKGLGYHGKESNELEVKYWNTGYVPKISITTSSGRAEMDFKVDEFIALAEIFKQLKEHRK